jgi:hypothetical protein
VANTEKALKSLLTQGWWCGLMYPKLENDLNVVNDNFLLERKIFEIIIYQERRKVCHA